MDIQIVSDIHLELRKHFPKIEPKSKILLLAGDIGNLFTEKWKLINFLSYLNSNWEKVFYVLGNHEYYNLAVGDASFKYQKLIDKYENITLLNNESIIYKDNLIIGSTLWSCPKIKYGLNDFNLIKGMTLEKMKQLNYEAIDYINKEIKTKSNFKRIIVLTHFPPLTYGVSDPKYEVKSNISTLSYFTNKWEKFNLSFENPIVWVSGHTHWSYDFKKNGIRYISNQIGYPNENTYFNSSTKYII